MTHHRASPTPTAGKRKIKSSSDGCTSRGGIVGTATNCRANCASPSGAFLDAVPGESLPSGRAGPPVFPAMRIFR